MKSQVIVDRKSEIEAESRHARDPHLLDVLILLAKRRKLILIFTFGAAVVGAIALLLLPSRYTAESVLLPPKSDSAISSALLSQAAGSATLASAAGASLGIKNPGDMYVSLLKSRTVEDAVIRRFGLMDRYRAKKMSDARTRFESHTRVTLGPKDGLITINVTDRDPVVAAQIANGYVDEFRKFSANLAITEASQRRVFFQQQLLDAKEKLVAAEEALKTTQQSTGVVQIDSQTRALVESVAELRAQVAAKEVELESMRSYATDENPATVDVRRQLEALQGQLRRLSGPDQDSGANVLALKGKLPEAGLEYFRKLRDVKFYDTISELIARQLEMAKLDEARQGVAIQTLDVAVPPDKRSFPKRGITMILAVVLGFFTGCAWCILAEGFSRFRSRPAESQRIEALRAAFR